jgi:hypothetical protein
VAQTGRIDQSQTAISLVAFFCGMKCLPGRATQGAIRLKKKVAPAEATLLERQSDLGCGIATSRWRVLLS